MKYIKRSLFATVLFVVNSASFAATAAATPAPNSNKGWQSTAELGIVVTGGNTKTSSVSGKFDSNKESEKWRYNLHAETLYASSAGVKLAEKYLASGQTNYKFSEHNYMFGLLQYDKDLFSGYQYQVTVAAGYGRRLINDEAMTLDLEIGPGDRITKLDTSSDPNAKAKNDIVLRTAAKFRWKVSDTSKFNEDLTSEASHKSAVTKSVTSLTTKINSSLAMKVSVTLKRTTHVPVGTRENDSETDVTLVYSF